MSLKINPRDLFQCENILVVLKEKGHALRVLMRSFRTEEDNIKMEHEHIGFCVDWIIFDCDNIQ